MPRALTRSETKAESKPPPTDFVRSDQFSFILKASPYYREAKENHQLPVFLDKFFLLYFTLWPDPVPENADFATIHDRQQKIRNTVLYNLSMTAGFYSEIHQSWEEFETEKLAEHVARKVKPVTRDSKGRPCPCPRSIRKLKNEAGPSNVITKRNPGPAAVVKPKNKPIPSGAKIILVDDSDDDLPRNGAHDKENLQPKY